MLVTKKICCWVGEIGFVGLGLGFGAEDCDKKILKLRIEKLKFQFKSNLYFQFKLKLRN